MSDKKRLMLIDGHALAYRAYHAIPMLTTPSGEPSNAVFGFANILLKAIDDHKPDYVVATFDSGVTFRHEEYEEYKATRAKMPDDLHHQLDRINRLTEVLGIPIFCLDGYEADDLMGTLSRQAEQEGLETIIVSGDSDTFQLITPDVRVLYPRRSFGDVVLYGPEQVRERYDLEPQQLVDLKALMGDSSDNIPGVRGVGEKTATRLLKKYGDVDTIYEHLDEVKQTRFRNALEAGEEDARFSRHLVEIVCDVDIELDLEAATWGDYDRDEVMDFLREMAFHSLVNRIPSPDGGPVDGQQLGLFGEQAATAEEAAAEGDYCVIDTVDELEALVEAIREAGGCAIDTETTSTDAMQADLVGISVAVKEGAGYYIPVGHRPGQGKGQLALERVAQILRPVLADEAIDKVFHNSKFDMIVLEQHGMPVREPIYDSLIAAWLLSPSGRGIGLKEQAWQRLGVEMMPIKDLIGSGRNQKTMDQVAIARVTPYACADADMTFRLHSMLRPDLESSEQWKLYTDMELPLVPVLKRMEMHGMMLDADYLATMSRELGERLAELEAAICEYAGYAFNINSTQQLGTVLFEELELPVVRRTKTGYSTAADVLEQLVDDHPIIPLVVQYRQLDKLKGTYVDSLPELVNPRTGRVHTSFNQTGTSTGRLSSSDPNLQNIPVRTELGRLVRGAFVAPEGHVLLGCDYSQVELRLLAHFSQDPELLGAFHRDEDVHASTAAAVFGVPLAEVTSEQRGLAKSINFGLMYGMSEFGLAARTNLSRAEAAQFIETYFERFAKVKDYLDETLERASECGYVETVMGRRRYFPELQPDTASSRRARQAAERAAINMPIQGSAADIIKIAMIELDEALQQRDHAGTMILQVHDELVLEVPEESLDATRQLVVETMSQAYPLDVPLKVDVAIAKNWMEMK